MKSQQLLWKHINPDHQPATVGALRMVIRHLALTCHEFSADDVWREAEGARLSPPSESRILGPILKQAEADGWIRPIDFGVSERPSRHGGFNTRWKSLLGGRS